MIKSRMSPGKPMTKAERLFDISLPDGSDFPLDEGIIEELEGYPGELPTTAEHFVDLLPDVAPGEADYDD